MARNDLPSISNRTSTLSRVVPGTSLTIIRSAWINVLMKVLLPTLRRPTKRDLHFRFGQRLVRGRLRQQCEDLLQQCVLVAILMRADLDQLMASQAVKLVRLRVQLRIIRLVGQTQNRFVDPSQPFGHRVIQGRDTRSRVDHEQQQVGRIDGDRNLGFDLRPSDCRHLQCQFRPCRSVRNTVPPIRSGASSGRGSRRPCRPRSPSVARPAN